MPWASRLRRRQFRQIFLRHVRHAQKWLASRGDSQKLSTILLLPIQIAVSA